MNGRGATWSPDNLIVFTPNITSPLFRVAATGGPATRVTDLDEAAGEISHRFPWFLPDGRHFLFTARSLVQDESVLYVGDLRSKDRRKITVAASNAAYTAPGFLVYLRDQTLVAQPFDAAGLRATGDPVPVAEHVDYISGNVQAQFAVSPKGILAFSSNPAADAVLTWYDRSGKALGEVGRPGNIFRFAISPDGGMVAVEHANPDSGNANIWLHDLKRGAESRFTFDQLSDTSFPGREGKWQITDQKGNFPVWRRDGKELYFIGRGGQLMAVDVKAGERFEHSAPKPLFKANKTANSLFDVGPDGRFLMATPPERDQSTPITVVLNWHSGLPGK